MVMLPSCYISRLLYRVHRIHPSITIFRPREGYLTNYSKFSSCSYIYGEMLFSNQACLNFTVVSLPNAPRNRMFTVLFTQLYSFSTSYVNTHMSGSIFCSHISVWNYFGRCLIKCFARCRDV